jgi:flagellar biogenesis protein FliO
MRALLAQVSARPESLADPLAGLAGGGLAAAPQLGWSAVWLLAVPLLLGLVTLLVRRRASPGRQLRIVETTSLGGRRALVLAQLGGESLLLASSEAGIVLLATRPAPQPLPQAVLRPAPAANDPATSSWGAAPGESFLTPVARNLSRWLGRGGRGGQQAPIAGDGARAGSQKPAAPSPFQSLLEESAEDLELRRKLANGRGGRVS